MKKFGLLKHILISFSNYFYFKAHVKVYFNLKVNFYFGSFNRRSEDARQNCGKRYRNEPPTRKFHDSTDSGRVKRSKTSSSITLELATSHNVFRRVVSEFIMYSIKQQLHSSVILMYILQFAVKIFKKLSMLQLFIH